MKQTLIALLTAAGSLLTLAAAPGTAQASTTFTDSNMAGWASSLAVGGACPSLTTSQPASGGNGGSFLQYTQQACGPMLASHLSAFSWNPATQGAISALTVGYDANWQSGSFMGDTRIGTHALLRQGGQTYLAMYSEVSGPAWSHFEAPLTASSWVGLNGLPAQPDFSSTGGLIEFGIATSNNCPGCGKTLSGGLDNYSLALTAQPVPEPASALLAAVGLLATVASARRAQSRSACQPTHKRVAMVNTHNTAKP